MHSRLTILDAGIGYYTRSLRTTYNKTHFVAVGVIGGVDYVLGYAFWAVCKFSPRDDANVIRCTLSYYFDTI